MTVKRIIDEKGRDVATIGPDATMAEVARLLTERRIGAMVVMQGGEVRGIVSERDFVKALASYGGEALGKRVADCMTSRVVTCRPEDTINAVMQTMTSGRFRHLPVLVGGRLGGIVSIGDVVKWRIAEVEREADEIRAYIATA